MTQKYTNKCVVACTKGERFSMGRQVENFEKTLMEISRSMSGELVKEYMAKSLVVVSLGNNDYINNYLKPSLFLTDSIYDPPSFADLLLSNFTTHLLVSVFYSIIYHVCEVVGSTRQEYKA